MLKTAKPRAAIMTALKSQAHLVRQVAAELGFPYVEAHDS
jgi:hypothetical protein